ncbi:hypothetical protein C2E23DRAFT_737317, partial [Lenzites betulinus]
LLFSVPPYAIELLRYKNMVREWQLCCFCQTSGEHILSTCTNQETVEEHVTLYQLLLKTMPFVLQQWQALSDWAFFAIALLDVNTMPLIAHFIHFTFSHCKSTLLLIVWSEQDLLYIYTAAL